MMSSPSSSDTNNEKESSSEISAATSASPSPRGVAGRTNYDDWHKRSKELLEEATRDDEEKALESKEALGHSRHAFSQVEAEEREKLDKAKATKKQLDIHQHREAAGILTLDQTWLDQELTRAATSSTPGTVYVTRDTFVQADNNAAQQEQEGGSKNTNLAPRRVLCLSHMKGPATIELSPELSKMECIPEVPLKETESESTETTEATAPKEPVKVYGLIKLFCMHLSNGIIVRNNNCKVITSYIELSHCSDTTLHITSKGGQNKISTIQVDLCQRIRLEYLGHDPSRDNVVFGGHKEDKIFHAGVSDMTILVARKSVDDANRLETVVDYKRDGAKADGSATAEEYQFITHVVSGKLVTERLLRMTNQKLVTEQELRNEILLKKKASSSSSSGDDELIYESNHPQAIDGLLTKYQVDDLIKSCEQHRKKGNEAFVAGEYAQAILWYTRAIDESEGLSGTLVKDEEEEDEKEDNASTPSSDDKKKDNKKEDDPNFFKGRSICYANRSACFLKLGHHDKALKDAEICTQLNPTYIKGYFRRGMALHAQKRFEEALPYLVKCLKMEPKNKQIQQAVKFCEIFLEKEHRARMEGS
jgi:tetratricopeptide (TPR) repeat protein